MLFHEENARCNSTLVPLCCRLQFKHKKDGKPPDAKQAALCNPPCICSVVDADSVCEKKEMYVLSIVYVLLDTLSAVPLSTGVPLTAADRAEHYSHRPTMQCTTATAQLHSCRDANDAAVICSA